MIYTILTLLLLASWYMIFKLFTKVEKHEETILTKTDDVLFLHYQFVTLLEKMQEIDNKKMFETDDEVGETFGQWTQVCLMDNGMNFDIFESKNILDG